MVVWGSRSCLDVKALSWVLNSCGTSCTGKSCLATWDLKIQQRSAQSPAKKALALCQKGAIPISTESCWRRKLIPTAHSLSWHALTQSMELVPGMVYSCDCVSLLWIHQLFIGIFSTGRLTKNFQFLFQWEIPCHGPAQDIPHENRMPFHGLL